MHGPFKVVPLNGVPSLQMPVIAAAGGEGTICGGEVVGAGAVVVWATAEKEKLVARAIKKNIFFIPTPRTRTETRAWFDSILNSTFLPEIIVQLFWKMLLGDMEQGNGSCNIFIENKKILTLLMRGSPGLSPTCDARFCRCRNNNKLQRGVAFLGPPRRSSLTHNTMTIIQEACHGHRSS